MQVCKKKNNNDSNKAGERDPLKTKQKSPTKPYSLHLICCVTLPKFCTQLLSFNFKMQMPQWEVTKPPQGKVDQATGKDKREF